MGYGFFPKAQDSRLLDATILGALACPRDREGLQVCETGLVCPQGHRFAIEGDVPLLTDHVRREPKPVNMPPCPLPTADSPVDPFVNDWIVNTNGNLYRSVRGKLPRYPIPGLPLKEGNGRLLVDIGCGWGRWSVAASRAGFRVIGLDVHIDALLAARRVSKQLGAGPTFLCAEANSLPLKSASVEVVFSNGVLQHLERPKVVGAFQEAARVLKPGATFLVQLANRFGPFALLRQAVRGFHDPAPGSFGMHYWSRAEIKRALKQAGLPSVSFRADGFLSQDPRLTDLDLLPLWGKLVVLASQAGCRLADVVPPLTGIADSFWVEARAPGGD